MFIGNSWDVGLIDPFRGGKVLFSSLGNFVQKTGILSGGRRKGGWVDKLGSLFVLFYHGR